MADEYLIRRFPPDLRRFCKVIASWQGRTMRELILRALEQYLQQYQEVGGLLHATSREEPE